MLGTALGVANTTLSAALSEISKASKEINNKTFDKHSEKEWKHISEKSGNTKFVYSADNYKNIGFDNAQQRQQFINYLSKEGINYVVPADRFNGSYTIQIENRQQDTTASAIIQRFEQSHSINTYDVKHYDIKNDSNSANREMNRASSDIAGFIFGEDPDFGRVFGIMQRGVYIGATLERWRQGEGESKYTVYGNGVVVHNGEQVLGKERDKILELHNERISSAYRVEGIDKISNTLNEMSEAVQKYEGKINNGETLTARETLKYEEYRNFLKEVSEDTGISFNSPVTNQEVSNYLSGLNALKPEDRATIVLSHSSVELFQNYSDVAHSQVRNNQVTDYINKNIDTYNKYSQIINDGGTLSAGQKAQYEKAKSIITDIEKDTGLNLLSNNIRTEKTTTSNISFKPEEAFRISNDINNIRASIERFEDRIKNGETLSEYDMRKYEAYRDTLYDVSKDTGMTFDKPVAAKDFEDYFTTLNKMKPEERNTLTFSASTNNLFKDAILISEQKTTHSEPVVLGNHITNNQWSQFYGALKEKAQGENSKNYFAEAGYSTTIASLVSKYEKPVGKLSFTNRDKYLTAKSITENVYKQEYKETSYSKEVTFELMDIARSLSNEKYANDVIAYRISKDLNAESMAYINRIINTHNTLYETNISLSSYYDNGQLLRNTLIENKLGSLDIISEKAGFKVSDLAKDYMKSNNIPKENVTNISDKITDICYDKINLQLANAKEKYNKKINAIKQKYPNPNDAKKYINKATEDYNKEVKQITDSSKKLYNEIKTTLPISEKEKDILIKAEKAFKLTDNERSMLTHNTVIMNELKNAKWTKGLEIGDKISAQGLVNINAGFLDNAAKKGYMFIKRNGTFDFKALNALTANQLKELDLTKNTRDLIANINEKGAFTVDGKGNVVVAFGIIGGAGRRITGFIIRHSENREGYAEIRQFQQIYAQTKRYSQDVITTVRKIKDIHLGDKLSNRINHSQNWQNAVQNAAQPKAPRKPLNEKQRNKISKYNAKNAKKVAAANAKRAKMVKRQNSVVGKASAALNKAKAKVANSVFGKVASFITKGLQKFVLIGVGILLGGGAVISAAVAVIMLILFFVCSLIDNMGALLDVGNWFAPQTYKDTVAYNLYQTLLQQEDIFVETLAYEPLKLGTSDEFGFDKVNFGFYSESIEDYIQNGKFDDLEYKESEHSLYINPFEAVGVSVLDTEDYTDDKYCTKVDKGVDGTHTYDITTNLNLYSLISNDGSPYYPSDLDASTVAEAAYGVSNGHTSNIKDIIAMTDVMYSMDATSSSDDNENYSIMGMSPAQLDIKANGIIAGQYMQTIGEFFSGIWDWITGGADDPAKVDELILTEEDEEGNENPISYLTVQGYAFNLFQMTHQTYLYIKPYYYDYKETVEDLSGNKVNLVEGTECEFGICANPRNEGFELTYEYSKDSPYPSIHEQILTEFENEEVVISEDTDPEPKCKVSLDWEDRDYDAEHDVADCLWQGLHIDYTNDRSNWERLTGIPCWIYDCIKEEEHIHTIEVPVHQHIEVKGGGTIKDEQGNSHSFTVNETRDEDMSENKTNAIESFLSGIEKKPDIYTYLAQNNDKNATWHEFDYKTSTLKDITFDMSPVVSTSPISGGSVTTTVTITMCHVEIKWLTERDYLAERVCTLEHHFKYCGGHLGSHSQGNVFSVTNEQLEFTEAQEEIKSSIALLDPMGTDYNSILYSDNVYDRLAEDKGGNRTNTNGIDFRFNKDFSELKGKVERENVDYETTAYNAAHSGGGVSPLEDIYQGTAVSKGLNIVVDSSGSWGTGIGVLKRDGSVHQIDYNIYPPSMPTVTDHPNEYSSEFNISYTGIEADKNLIYLCRDIFDCDCIILKGKNIFPMTDFTQYEGWTSDNMFLVLCRMAMDWYEIYGFDINTEIGQHNNALSEQDINMLICGLKAEYPDYINIDTEAVIRALLHQVGRGHYTNHTHSISLSTYLDNPSSMLLSNDGENDKSHAYKAFLCYAKTGYNVMHEDGTVEFMNFSGSCGAGDSLDLANYLADYIIKYSGMKKYDGAHNMVASLGYNDYTRDATYSVNHGGVWTYGDGYGQVISGSRLFPLEVFYHQSLEDYKNRSDATIEDDEENHIYKLDIDIEYDPSNPEQKIDGKLLKQYHCDEQACISLGAFSEVGMKAMVEYLISEGVTDEVLFGTETTIGYIPASDFDQENEDYYPIGNDQHAPSKIRLTNGQIIQYAFPIMIDISQMGIYTGLCLKANGTSGSNFGLWTTNYDTGSIVAHSQEEQRKTEKAMHTSYYWLVQRGNSVTTPRIAVINLGRRMGLYDFTGSDRSLIL